MVACCFMTDVPLKLSSVTCNVGQSGMVFIAAFVIILLRSWTFFGKGWKNSLFHKAPQCEVWWSYVRRLRWACSLHRLA